MTERGFNTGFWTEGFVQKLPKDGKLLLSYLKTNEHCNPAGVYHITLTTIAFETKIPEPDLPSLLETLAPAVGWYQDEDMIWVKDFIKEQTNSSKFLAAAAKALVNVANNGLIKQVISYNQEKYMISIPYQYYMDRVSILTRASVSGAGADSGSRSEKGEEVAKGKGETKLTPRSRLEAEETLCEGDRGEVAPKGAGETHQAEGDGAIISTLRSVKGFKMAPAAEAELVARMRTEFPELDLPAQVKAWAARKLSEPLEPKSRPSQQIWHWMEMARKFAKERSQRGEDKRTSDQGQRVKAHPREAFRGKW